MPLLDNSQHLARVWRANARASLVREMEFRTNFVLGILRHLGWALTYVFFINIVFRNTTTLSGWSQAEVILILALSRIIEGLINVLYSGNLVEMSQLVQKGQLDLHLVKPLPLQFSVAFNRVMIYQIGNIIIGLGLLLYAIILKGDFPTPAQWLTFLLVTFLALIIFYSLLIIVSSLAFFLERLESLYAFYRLFSEPFTVPFDVFPRGPRLALTYILPLAFVVFVPAQALTGRLVWWQLPLALLMTIIFLIVANIIWRAGLRRYTSASS